VVDPIQWIRSTLRLWYNGAVNSPKVRDQVESEDFGKALVVCPRYNDSQPDENSDVRQDNLPILVGCKHDSVWIEVLVIDEIVKIGGE
jgi:hypothetical protein